MESHIEILLKLKQIYNPFHGGGHGGTKMKISLKLTGHTRNTLTYYKLNLQQQEAIMGSYHGVIIHTRVATEITW